MRCGCRPTFKHQSTRWTIKCHQKTGSQRKLALKGVHQAAGSCNCVLKGTFHILTDNNNNLNIHSSQVPHTETWKENSVLRSYQIKSDLLGYNSFFFLFLFKLFKRMCKGRQCWFCQSLDFMSNLQCKIAFRLCHWGFQTNSMGNKLSLHWAIQYGTWN